MTARTRPRTILVAIAAAALAAPIAAVAVLAGPVEAAGNVGPRKHEVTMYKVEQQLDLSGEFPDSDAHEHLYCDNGDIALDGMWRVEHVDQFDPSDEDPDDPEGGFYHDERDVVVYASYPDSSDNREWHFRLENFSQGNAQVKLFITCIKGRTEATANHGHDINISPVYTDTSHHSLGAGAQDLEFDGTCDPGYYAVAPGFNFVNNEYNEPFRSWPIASGRSWHWAFKVTDPHPELNVYLRCLRKKVDSEFGPGASKKHTHKVPMVYRPNLAGFATDVSPAHRSVERRFDCDQGAGNYSSYKAMVGAFWIDDPHHVWFLGMDPRPKQRAYRFWYDGSSSNTVYLGALCIRARTDKQIKP
jgi:hypothetical protein